MSRQHRRLPSELETKLREQLGFVRKSSDLFDSGDETEADRIAVSLRVLFHQTHRSQSLLEQVGMTEINLRSSHDPRRVSHTHNHLIRLQIQTVPASIRAIPFLEDSLAKTLVRFDEWWDVEPVFNLGERAATRRSHVLSLANKDGAHVDPDLTDFDKQLRTFCGFSLNIVEPWDGCGGAAGEVRVAENALRASIRQIAHEVLCTPSLRPFLT